MYCDNTQYVGVYIWAFFCAALSVCTYRTPYQHFFVLQKKNHICYYISLVFYRKIIFDETII
jgi:hypothetical protein